MTPGHAPRSPSRRSRGPAAPMRPPHPSAEEMHDGTSFGGLALARRLRHGGELTLRELEIALRRAHHVAAQFLGRRCPESCIRRERRSVRRTSSSRSSSRTRASRPCLRPSGSAAPPSPSAPSPRTRPSPRSSSCAAAPAASPPSSPRRRLPRTRGADRSSSRSPADRACRCAARYPTAPSRGCPDDCECRSSTPCCLRERGEPGEIASHRRHFRAHVLQRVFPVADLRQLDARLARRREDRARRRMARPR